MNWGFKSKKTREMEDEIKRLNSLEDTHRELIKKHTQTIKVLERTSNNLVSKLQMCQEQLFNANIEVNNSRSIIKDLKNNNKRKPRRRELSHKVGFKHVNKEESIEIYKMWKNHIPLSDIALHFKRSNSTVANHVRKQMEEEDAREQQVENLPGRETIRTKEEE